MNENFSMLDILTIFSVLLQIKGVENDSKQTTNNDLMQELMNQDRKYLEKILKNQELILSKLAN